MSPLLSQGRLEEMHGDVSGLQTLSQKLPNAETARQLACARCGAPFTCNAGGPCWCSEEPVRLPLPAPGASATGFDDCLCRDCLRQLAADVAPEATGRGPST